MKYTIMINQVGIVKAGLHTKTDMIDWAILDYLKDWYFSGYARKLSITEDSKHIDYVWVNYSHLLQNMPIIGIKNKDALTKRFKKLRKLGLIKTFQTKDNTLYFILTPLAIETFYYQENDTLSDDGRTGCPTTVGQGCPTTVGQGLSDDGRTGTSSISYQVDNQASRISNNNITVQIDKNRSEPPEDPPVITLPLNDKTEYPIPESLVREYEELYPMVNVRRELKQMRAWLLSNPKRRKTRRGILRFVNNWLSKEQDRLSRIEERERELIKMLGEDDEEEQDST